MSTEATAEMMNEVIARFMGGTRIQHPEQKFFSEDHFGYVCHKGHWWNEKKLQYHTSWDWLMPVGKKIRDLLSDMQKKRPPHTACHGDVIEVDIHCAVSSYNIVNTHKHMYTFITWYNEYQQKQTNADGTPT